MIAVARRMPTRLERTAAEFERAGRRGLSRRELRRVAGPRFQEVLDALAAEGYLVMPKVSQFDRKPWRWTVVPPLVDEPQAGEVVTEPPASQLQLGEPTEHDGAER